ncbi:MAG: FHA domain-containing protein [Anaerolineales bacterium]
MHPLPAALCCLSLWLGRPSPMESKGRGIFPADETEPLEVVLLSPADGDTIGPSEYIPEGDKPSTPAKGVVVTASVSVRGGPPRSLRQARLLVNGEVRSVLNSPPQSFTFVWNPADGYPSGPVTLQVEVEDETGARGVSRQIIIRIVEGSIFCPAGSVSFLCGSSPSGLLPFLAIVTGLIVIGLLVVCRKGEAGAEGDTGTSVDDTLQTLRFGERVEAARAVLSDLDGNAEAGRDVVELFGTTSIGRSRRSAGLVLQAGRAESPVSRLHCTVLEEDGAFFLRDEQSANGTYLNGLRLAPTERNPLKDGDEIGLAQPERGGVRLRFELRTGKETSSKSDGN